MTDEHETLTAEYERLVQAFETQSAVQPDIVKAIVHILQRLGPPDPMDAIDADVRQSLKA